MALNGTWVPQTKEEDRLMEDIFISTRRAAADGVELQRVAALLAFMASATLDPRSLEDSRQEPTGRSMEEVFEQSEADEGECPICGEDIKSVSTEMGGKLHIFPCEHTLDWGELELLGEEWESRLDPTAGEDE